MNHTHDALGLYVLGTLETDERREFERHLSGCPTCRADLVGFDETAARLSQLASAPPPPDELRTAVLAGLADVQQLRPPRRPVALAAPPGRGVAGDARAVRLARRTRVLTLLVAAVTLVALALGGVVVSLVHQPTSPVAGPAADASLLSAPDARIVAVTFPDGTHGSFVVSTSQNRALFVARNLPDPGPGRTYQLWRLRAGTPYPDSTVEGGAEVAQWFHGSVTDAGGLAVTVEPDGGSAAPTSPVLASATL